MAMPFQRSASGGKSNNARTNPEVLIFVKREDYYETGENT